MKKPVIGIILGTVVCFVWGAVSWMVLPWHNSSIRTLPEEQLIMDTVKTVVSDPGFYIFPSNKTPNGQMDKKLWEEKYKKGPNGILVFSPGGHDFMPPQAFLFDILSNLIIASITMLILNLSRDRVKSIVPRAFLVAAIGIAVGTAAHGMYWNWFHFPTDFTCVALADTFISFLLLGFTQAKFVAES